MFKLHQLNLKNIYIMAMQLVISIYKPFKEGYRVASASTP